MADRRSGVVGAALVAGALLTSLAVVTGVPDLRDSLRFWRGDRPDSAATWAAAASVAWVAVGAVAVTAVVGAVRAVFARAAGAVTVTHRRWAVVAAGVLILALGLLHRDTQPTLCCGDLSTAQQLLQHDRGR